MPGSTIRSTDRSSVNPSKTEPSDNWCSGAPGRRIWQTNQSLHYLSNFIHKQSHIVFRRARQNAMAEPANPAGPFSILERAEISIQMLLQFFSARMQQSLIEVALDESTRRNIERFTDVPSMIDTDAGKTCAGKERVTQVRRLRSFRVITDALSAAAGDALQLR